MELTTTTSNPTQKESIPIACNEIPIKNFVICDKLLDCSKINQGNYTLFKINGHNLPYYILTHIKKPGNKTIFFFSGALGDPKIKPPRFNRWQWATSTELTKYNCVYLGDPTQFIENVKCGWYLQDILYEGLIFKECIQQICTYLGITNKDCIFSGSSSGGYAAIRYSLLFPKSIAIVENAQDNPFKYHKQHVSVLREVILDKKSVNEEDFDLGDIIIRNKLDPEIYWFQTPADEFHYKTFFLNMRERMKNYPKIKFQLVKPDPTLEKPHNQVMLPKEYSKVLNEVTGLEETLPEPIFDVDL